MGQAKQRGTLEQRVAMAIERDAAIMKERNLALTTPLLIQKRRKTVLETLALISLLANN